MPGGNVPKTPARQTWRVTRQPLAIFVVRAWDEQGQFRARVSRSYDIEVEPTLEFVTANSSELLQYLEVWVRELTRGSDTGPPAGHS